MKKFISMLLPLIAGNILQQFYNTIDTVIIGRFASYQEFAAAGLSSSIMNLLLFAIIGFCTGVSVLFSRSYGAGDTEELKRNCSAAVTAGTLAVLALSSVFLLLMPQILHLMNTPESLFSFSLSYLRIITGGLFISYLYNLAASLLRSIGRPSIALAALLLSVIFNTLLDLLFIAVYQRGIAGAAAATVIAQCFSTGFCLVYLRLKCPDLRLQMPDLRFNLPVIRHLFSIGSVTCIHQISLYLGKLLIQGTVNAAGTDLISAYTATGRIEGFANSFGDSGYTVTSVLTAQQAGANDSKGIQETWRTSLIVLSLLGILSSAAMYCLAPSLSSFLLGNQPAAVRSSTGYLRLISLFYIFCFTGNTFAGYFDGIEKVQIPFAGALGHMTLRVILSLFWIPAFGLSGLAAATGLGWILVNIFWYRMKKMKNPAFSSKFIRQS